MDTTKASIVGIGLLSLLSLAFAPSASAEPVTCANGSTGCVCTAPYSCIDDSSGTTCVAGAGASPTSMEGFVCYNGNDGCANGSIGCWCILNGCTDDGSSVDCMAAVGLGPNSMEGLVCENIIKVVVQVDPPVQAVTA